MKKTAYSVAIRFLIVALLFSVVIVTIQAPSVKIDVEEHAEEIIPVAVEPVPVPEPEITHLANISEPIPVEKVKPVVEVDGKDDTPVEELKEVNPEELELLACVIYQEAGGNESCDECRRRVADVVLTRMADERFPDTMLEVLTQKTASGYGAYGRFHWTGVIWPDRAYTDGERPAVERAYQIAEEVLNGTSHSDLYGKGYIWQAEFIQGTDIVYCCNTYFGRG